MYNIFHDLVINSSPEYVFDAISDPEKLNNWWTLKCSGTPEIGEIYNLHFTPEYDWYAKVTQCERGKMFHLKMTKADEDWDPTSFEFVLEKIDNGTWVKFAHRGWESNNDHFRRSSFCWAMLLNGLKNYVEEGIVVPFEERE